MIHMGDYNELSVLRETRFAYILTDGETEVFLHKNQTHGSLAEGQVVRVFLYYDNQKRITATMNEPLIDQQKAAFVEVVDASFKLGAWLDIGLKKDLLLSMDDLPFVKNEWPQRGDRIFAKLKVNKNQLTARPLSRYQIREHLRPTTPLEEGQVVEATNIFKAEEGNVFCTDEGHLIFVYFKHMRERFRLGQRASMTILIDKGEFEYNGTMIEHKEKMLEEDAARLVAYMESHDGMMPYTDKTSPEIIQMVFKMSKSAFKRALGTLYKERLIAFDEDKTRLLKPLNIDDN